MTISSAYCQASQLVINNDSDGFIAQLVRAYGSHP